MISSASFAQYEIINKPQGVYLKRINGYVKQGQIIQKEDEFQFMNTRSTLKVKGKGKIYEISKDFNPLNQTRNSDSPFVREVKSTFVVKNNLIKAHSRGTDYTSIEQIIQNFEYKNDLNQPMFIIDSTLIEIDFINPKDFEKKYFYIKYSFNGEDIYKKIKYHQKEDKVYLNFTEELFYIDGKHSGLDFLSPVTFYYEDRYKNTTTNLAEFHILFKSFSDIKTELEQVGTIEENETERESAVVQYIQTYYGKADWSAFSEKYYPLLNFE